MGMLAIIGTLNISGYLSMQENIKRALQERLNLTQTLADHWDYILQQNLSRLESVSFFRGVNLEDSDLIPEKEALHAAYLNSIFSEGVFLLDSKGYLLWMEPFPKEWLGTDFFASPEIKSLLRDDRPVVSSLIKGKGPFAFMPIKNWQGKLVGWVGGIMNPLSPYFSHKHHRSNLNQTAYLDIIDQEGTVISSSIPYRVLKLSDHGSYMSDLIRSKKTAVGTCSSCHKDAKLTEARGPAQEVIAFAPLSMAPWGVSTRQAESEVLAPAQGMLRRFLVYSLFLFFLAIIMAWGIGLSITRPVNILTRAAQKISSGNLEDPIPSSGKDEIARLALTFDQMRLKLKESIDTIELWNRELEQRVKERTKDLEASQAALKRKELAHQELLKEVISIQEEERKRVARELHDETSQILSALILGLDSLREKSSDSALKENLQNTRSLAEDVLNGIHRLIFDLRPAMLDDLGLLPAIHWFAQKQLNPLGVGITFEGREEEKRLPGPIETAIFRVVQEAINNIAKHAQAENVVISYSQIDQLVSIEIEDDGKGFDIEELRTSTDRKRGLGLLGMKERINQLEGSFKLETAPAMGTRITIGVALPP
jgi:signal transduction histidine kinase